MKKGCITTLLVLVGLYGLLSLWDIYASRPSALYERWLGELFNKATEPQLGGRSVAFGE